MQYTPVDVDKMAYWISLFVLLVCVGITNPFTDAENVHERDTLFDTPFKINTMNCPSKLLDIEVDKYFANGTFHHKLVLLKNLPCQKFMQTSGIRNDINISSAGYITTDPDNKILTLTHKATDIGKYIYIVHEKDSSTGTFDIHQVKITIIDNPVVPGASNDGCKVNSWCITSNTILVVLVIVLFAFVTYLYKKSKTVRRIILHILSFVCNKCRAVFTKVPPSNTGPDQLRVTYVPVQSRPLTDEVGYPATDDALKQEKDEENGMLKNVKEDITPGTELTEQHYS